MSIIFGRTQDSWQTPFDPTDPNAIAEGLTSPTVQEAIIEAKRDSINNDRYPIQCSYGGNAGVGRRLEIFPGIDSAEAPFIAPEASKIVSYVFQASSPATGTITIRNMTTAVDLIDVVFSGQSKIVVTGINVVGIGQTNDVEIFVKSGNFNKPRGRIWFNTIT